MVVYLPRPKKYLVKLCGHQTGTQDCIRAQCSVGQKIWSFASMVVASATVTTLQMWSPDSPSNPFHSHAASTAPVMCLLYKWLPQADQEPISPPVGVMGFVQILPLIFTVAVRTISTFCVSYAPFTKQGEGMWLFPCVIYYAHLHRLCSYLDHAPTW